MSLPLPSSSQPPEERAASLIRLLEDNSQGDYIGESISQLEHSLQCAHMALKAGSSPSTITAALLHDIGQFIPVSLLKASADKQTDVGRPNHATTGAAYLSSIGFPSHTTNIIAQHVAAKRYLTSIDKSYLENLSEASKKSLRQQGGPMSEIERSEFEQMEGWRECVEVRRWDDLAKEVGVERETPRVGEYVSFVGRVLSDAQSA